MPKVTTAIFYLTNSSLSVQTERSLLLNISLPKEEKDLSKALSGISKIKGKVQQGIIVLGEGVLSQVVIEKDEDEKKAQETLLASLPFSDEYAQIKSIPTEQKKYLLAANQHLYSAVIEETEKIAIAIDTVVPLSLFSDAHSEDALDKKDVRAILNRNDLYDIGNFYKKDTPLENVASEPEPIESEPVTETETDLVTSQTYSREISWNTSKLLLILGFLIILTAGMGGLIYVQQSRDYAKEAASNLPEVTSTPTPTPTIVVKSELKVKVENGTGTPGQAGKVKELLENAEFANIETGNAETSEHEKTEVIFSSLVPNKIQEEVKALLLEDFTAVTSKVDSHATIDILVITGEEK